MKGFTQFLKESAEMDQLKLNFTKLTAAQLDKILQNSGYDENDIVDAQFRSVTSKSQFLYVIKYRSGDKIESGDLYVYINKNGDIRAEF